MLGTPAGNKYYFIGRSANDTIVVTDANFQVIARRNAGAGATNAAMTPDGRYLVLAGGQNGNVQILRTADDSLVTQVDAGGAIDVAVSRDGQRAFAVNLAGRVTAIDMTSFSQVGTQNLTGGVGGIAVGPNGFIYVAATNAIYEMDYASASSTFTIRQNQAIGLNGVPGKPVIVAEGVSGLRLLVANTIQFPGSAALFNVDLLSRSVTPIAVAGVLFDRIVPVSFGRAFAISTAQQLYDIQFTGSQVTPASFTGLTGAGVRGAAPSSEFPNARYLYVASGISNTLARVELATGNTSLLPITSVPGNVSFAGPASTAAAAKVYTFNNGQTVAPGAQTPVPLILRAVDANDRPVSGAPVTCSITTTGGGQVNSASSTTDGEGYAQAFATAPQLTGGFQVTCNVGSGVVVAATFNLNSGTGGGGGTVTSGTVFVKSGNGQVVRETGATPDLLRVVVRDANQNPVAGVTVNWSVITPNGPNGSLANTTTITDNFGESTNTYIAPFLGGFVLSGYVQSTITAATANNQVSMYVTVIPQQFSGQTLPLPTVQILKPSGIDTISGNAGTTVTGAIQTKVFVGAGPAVGAAIPNVAVNVTTSLPSSSSITDPTLAPTASCAQDGGKGLSDASGIATCDLIIGGKTGTALLTITMGGQTIGQPLNLVVTSGLPGAITIVQGDGQSGPAGTQLPLALVAQVSDSFGNLLSGANVTWAVESGTATLLNTITRSDTTARVSSLVRLGAAPGPVRVRVTAVGGTSSATVVFNLTVSSGVTQLVAVSGDGQSAVLGQAFSQPIVAQVRDGNGQPVPGVQVSFTVRSGQASLSPPSAVTDAQGQVRTVVTAGLTAGTVVVAAEFGGNSATFTLTVRVQGPSFGPEGVTNAASGLRSIAPGSIATIRGTNFASNVRGYVLPASPVGPLPTTLSGISVTFGGIPAPIFWVANVNGVESVTVQVPFEVPDNATVPVTVNSSGAATSADVQVSAVAPGIFEDVDEQGRRFAVVTRQDGTFVTPDNPLERGQQATVLVTGLGRTGPNAFTNAQGGGGQRPVADIAVGVANNGVPLVNVEYARGLIGVYAVTFEVPGNIPSGGQNLAVGANGVFGNSATLNVR